MTTEWTLPSIISQFAEDGGETAHISWTDQFPISTTGFLMHIARAPRHDIQMKTYYLKLTGFNFRNLPTTLSGVEMRITARRRGRIMNETIQLCIGNRVSDNRATLHIEPVEVFGGATDLWSMKDLSLVDVADSNFGVVVRLQSHTHWPHKDAAIVDAVELRIH